MDCLTANQASTRGYSDAQQLEFSTAVSRVLFTNNARDFQQLHGEWMRAGLHHAGIVVLTDQWTPIGIQLRAFRTMATRFSESDMHDRLEFLLNHA